MNSSASRLLKRRRRDTKMKAFINVLIKTDAYEDKDMILDAVLTALQAEGLEVVWSKASEAKD